MDKTIQNQSKSKRKLIFSFFQFNYPWNSNLVKILPPKKTLKIKQNKTIFTKLQPVFLSINIKTFQGTIRCCCAHARINNNHDQPPPSPPTPLEIPLELQQQPIEQDSFVEHPKTAYKFALQCPYASNEYCNVLLECNKLNSKLCEINSTNAANQMPNTDPNQPNQKKPVKPTVSINVTDTENLNVCMCSLYASCDNVLVEQESMIGSICPRCQNIIKQQPTEHRKTLISKRLTLSKDIIVNRVDTHFLSLKTALGDNGKRYEPYTPESIESHSPLPEPDILEYEQNENGRTEVNNASSVDATTDPFDMNNKVHDPVRSLSTHSSAVSARQLKSRLEILRKTSTDASGMVISNHITENRKRSIKRGLCFNKCCVILWKLFFDLYELVWSPDGTLYGIHSFQIFIWLCHLPRLRILSLVIACLTLILSLKLTFFVFQVTRT